MGDKLRLHVGGLGSNVQVSDLEKTFTSPQLGDVQSVEIIRTKGRSFAYLEFVPASDKGLAKLFSTYNGCMWKGGRLKLEKAKENYQSRLRREWMEDAQHETKLPSQNVDADESGCAMLKPKKEDLEKMQLKIFFPKLRKLKAIPLKGTGKHKYSFQRIEVPLLPTHFCDCEEHFVPPEPAKRNYSRLPGPAKRNNTVDREVDNYGMNEEELNMMKSILDKLLEKEIRSEIVSSEAEPSEEIQHDASVVDKCQVDDNEEDQDSDEDNLVINIVGKPSKRDTLFEDWGQKTSITNQDSLVSGPKSLSNTNSKKQEAKRPNQMFDKKRKQSVREDKSIDTVPSKKKGRTGFSHNSTDDQVAIDKKPVDKDSGSIRLSSDVATLNKSAWKALVSEKGNTAFNISDILTNHNSDIETEPGSDIGTEPGSDIETEPGSDIGTGPSSDIETEPDSDIETAPGFDIATESCSNGNNGQKDQTSKHEELEKLSDVQSTEPTASEDLLARGASWKRKSSWLQLVADTNASAFNLSQILPDVTFQKQATEQFKVIDFSNSSRAKQHKFVDKKSCAEDIGEPQGPANRDIYANTSNQNEDVLTKEQNTSGPVSHSTEKVGEDSSAPVLGTNLIPSNRPMGDIVISETCPFMKSAASMKEWAKSKAALSGSHKRKGKETESLKN
ncbi:protein REPRESSOR OF SILENCING 3 [Salvia miltiorrhiza]|uniref:protein REPRESSOR OF SILENCING 3 n=1 Tax=Salvia miltiorrhiza TaxID=226208 RepID=UPI0025AC3621|nr:protein REPRESSOR OF SILENCING 3 [Salvia miltiorrhiza]